jgi:hypothetical protein
MADTVGVAEEAGGISMRRHVRDTESAGSSAAESSGLIVFISLLDDVVLPREHFQPWAEHGIPPTAG